jgi:hypothetical protein
VAQRKLGSGPREAALMTHAKQVKRAIWDMKLLIVQYVEFYFIAYTKSNFTINYNVDIEPLYTLTH